MRVGGIRGICDQATTDTNDFIDDEATASNVVHVSYITAMNPCICIGVTGSVALTEAVSVSSSVASPVWITGTVQCSGPASVAPVDVYQSLAYGLFSPTGSNPAVVSALWNSTGSLSLRVHRVSVSVTHDALSNPNPTAFAFMGRGPVGPSVSGSPITPERLDPALGASKAIAYSGATDLFLSGSAMAGGVVPPSLTNLGLHATAVTSLNGVAVGYELVAEGDTVVVAPGRTLVVGIDPGNIISGDPEYAYAVTYYWSES